MASFSIKLNLRGGGWLCLCICSKNNVPVFHLNYERKDLALRVTVNNMNEDDAYEAKLVGTFPDTLSYSGVRSHQTTVNKTREKMYMMMILMMLYGRPIKLNRQSHHLKTALTCHHTTETSCPNQQNIPLL